MKEQIAQILSKHLPMTEEEVLALIEIPKDSKLGDFAFPCFSLAKSLKKNPVDIAKETVSKIRNVSQFEQINALGPYINFFVNRNMVAQSTLSEILKKKDKYGSSIEGKGKKIVIDLSAPNIAKPFGIGHLRSTIIGNSISNIASFLGYKTIKINYLGDWGTQFGKLIVGYKKWGNAKKLKSDPINHLLELYVKVNADETLEDAAREEFRKLEQGDKKNLALWKQFRELSLKDFNEIYELLGVKFDVISGESLYNKKLDAVVKMLEHKKLLKESDGAKVVDLSEYNLGVCLIQKSDGTTLYATRDIAAALDRKNKYNFDSAVYEVGLEQSLHFKQIFKVLELLGNDWARSCTHVGHGLYLDQDGKKFSTRKGKNVFMADILKETIDLAKKEIQSREKLSSKELERRARIIALSAIIYGDLRNYRENSIVFDIDRFLQFEGNTGPYILYTYARCQSIIKKSNFKKLSKITVITEKEKALVSHLYNFHETVKQAYLTNSPNLIANYAYELSQKFNEFYHDHPVIGSNEENFRLALVSSCAQVLKNSLSLLGIPVLQRM
ncbi:MAG TPA: arginine--tRNA ligase [Candidatus Nanoarchaeia archaeon]|nr:arginine--tRNA ligase [Candidatus Nanoarchaeia archaeon]